MPPRSATPGDLLQLSRVQLVGPQVGLRPLVLHPLHPLYDLVVLLRPPIRYRVAAKQEEPEVLIKGFPTTQKPAVAVAVGPTTPKPTPMPSTGKRGDAPSGASEPTHMYVNEAGDSATPLPVPTPDRGSHRHHRPVAWWKRLNRCTIRRNWQREIASKARKSWT